MLGNMSYQLDDFALKLRRIEAETRRRKLFCAILSVAILVSLAVLFNG
ncbi:hypothetical protein [Sulfitobacter sp. UBA4523]|mgnify:CR=1 FL=1|jgi:hypothetical protein|nr:hypothetical protein [Sulfitobacter sp. UBA4523]|tara:strand:- start:16726 stop:16869 length:144 start_codon:yes stop_codon:yes gene_type:complete